LRKTNKIHKKTDKIQWHAAFRQALKVELYDYINDLEFIEEHPLTTEPLKIDTLVIKKLPETRIEKNIGRIFKGHNVAEFKGPGESLDMDAYNKTFAYAYLYAYAAHVDINDVTLTLVVNKRPIELLKYLKSERNLKVEKAGAGICYIIGEVMPVQLIETKLLTEEENLWLKALRRGLPKPTLERVVDESRRYGNDLGAYMYAIMEANQKLLKGDDEMGLAQTMLKNPVFVECLEKLGYRRVFDGDGEVSIDNAVTVNPAFIRQIKKLGFGNITHVAKTMLADNEPLEKIVRYTGLPREEIESLRDDV
jgi:hypothetical protein